MPDPRLLETRLVDLAEIDDSKRLRPVSQAGVDALIASYRELGVMKDPIDLRRTKAGTLVLMAGGHRMGMARELGWEQIEAKIWIDVTDDWAALMEIDDNLAGAEMNALDNAVFLATRKRIYEKLHPETKYATGAELAGKRWGNASDIVSFASATAEKFGVSKRHVERMVAAGASLESSEIDLLRGSPRQVTLKDLTEIAKIGNEEERRQVVLRLSSGKVKSASEARKSLVAETVEPPVQNPVEVEFKALLTAWGRAGASARRRFVAEVYAELSELTSDEYERREM